MDVVSALTMAAMSSSATMYAVGPSMILSTSWMPIWSAAILTRLFLAMKISAAAVGDVATEVVHLSGVDVGVSCGDDEGFVLDAIEDAGEDFFVAF